MYAKIQDLHELPKLRDSLSYVYIEHALVNQQQYAIEFTQKEGRTLVPIANLSVLLLGPGTSITHAAIKALGDNGCSVIWVGQEATHFYANGAGETRKAYQVLRQAELVSTPALREQVVIQMYRFRFQEQLPTGLSLPHIRGLEGVRVRQAYAEASKQYGVKWSGRNYDRKDWQNTDPINRALSCANALLNALCHTAIISGGYSPALGFIHTGKQLAFVYDVADLYKVQVTVPVAFQTVAQSPDKVEQRVRVACREKFRELKLLERILPDIDSLLKVDAQNAPSAGDTDADPALPEKLWHALEEDEDE